MLNRAPRPRNPTAPRCQFKSNGTRQRRFQSTTSTPEANLSLSQRLRKLSREYGWSAVGIYFALSALDFPFCFLAVKTLGTDRIGHWEHVALSWIKSVIPEQLMQVEWPWGQQEVEAQIEGPGRVDGKIDPLPAKEEIGGKRILEEGSADYDNEVKDGTSSRLDHGYDEAEKANRGVNASIWTQLALAYAIHKSFIFIRVPLTAAVTPKVVKTLRGWGWNIGKRPMKGAKKVEGGAGTGVNTTGTGIKPDR